eukprot:4793177-Alexandrium_andersonii.AAC.1
MLRGSRPGRELADSPRAGKPAAATYSNCCCPDRSTGVASQRARGQAAVSYTHLTLPTICSV